MYDKQTLRKEKIKARDSLSERDRSALSDAVCRQILASGEYNRAETVMLYKAVRGEVRLDLLEVQNASSPHPKRLIYPLCTKDGLLAIEPGSTDPESPAWKKGSFGIPEPDPDLGNVIAPESIDLIICPLVAFDEEGRRLGMGGGYYDRFLPLCKNAFVTAAAFAIQETGRVPDDSYDQRMQKIYFA